MVEDTIFRTMLIAERAGEATVGRSNFCAIYIVFPRPSFSYLVPAGVRVLTGVYLSVYLCVCVYVRACVRACV